jgi:tetratricopeptide (TPR) repeat protein
VVGNDLVLVSAHTGYNFYLGNNPEANGYLIMPSAAPRSATDNPTDQRDYFTKMAEADVGTELKPSEVSRYWTRKGLAFIADHPALWLEILGKKLVRIINEFEFSDNQNYYFALQYSFVLRLPLFGFGFVCPLSLLGLILSARKWRPLALLYLFVIGYGASLMVFFSGSRYRMLFVPFLIIFAAHALYWIYENLKARRFRPLVMGGALLVLFTYLAFLDVPGISKDPHFVDYYNLGNKYLHKNRFDKAVEAFEQSIALRPNYLSSHNNLASAYEHNGEPDKALKEWKKLRALAKRKKSRVHLERAVRHIEALEAKRRE